MTGISPVYFCQKLITVQGLLFQFLSQHNLPLIHDEYILKMHSHHPELLLDLVIIDGSCLIDIRSSICITLNGNFLQYLPVLKKKEKSCLISSVFFSFAFFTPIVTWHRNVSPPILMVGRPAHYEVKTPPVIFIIFFLERVEDGGWVKVFMNYNYHDYFYLISI